MEYKEEYRHSTSVIKSDCVDKVVIAGYIDNDTSIVFSPTVELRFKNNWDLESQFRNTFFRYFDNINEDFDLFDRIESCFDKNITFATLLLKRKQYLEWLVKFENSIDKFSNWFEEFRDEYIAHAESQLDGM